jgi:hypothetical protein
VKPALQLKSHVPPTQVAVAFAGGLQGVHDAPHWAGLVSATQLPEHE